MLEYNSRGPGREPIFLRFPKGLRSQLEEEARASERSLTAEIVFRLKLSLKSNLLPSAKPKAA